MTLLMKNGYRKPKKAMETRATIVNRIECLEEILRTQNLSTCSQDRIRSNIKNFKRDLEVLDEEGDIAMIQQMVFEHGLTTL